MNEPKMPPLPQMKSGSALEIEESLAALRDWWRAFTNYDFEVMQAVFGSFVKEFQHSRSTAEAALRSPDGMVRCAAIQTLDLAWEKTPEILSACEQLIERDPDDKVKIAAISYVSSYYCNSTDYRTTRLLAKIVASEAEGNEVRAAAYWGLRMILNADFARTDPQISGNRFPKDVDWHIVNQYCNRSPQT